MGPASRAHRFDPKLGWGHPGLEKGRSEDGLFGVLHTVGTPGTSRMSRAIGELP